MDNVLRFKLLRKDYGDNYTRGSLYLNGSNDLWCSTLERDKNSGMLIPAKLYKVILTMSNRFKRLLPLLVNVPNMEGIRIHVGNTYKDSTGCILVGDLTSKDFISNSKVTENKLVDLMKTSKDISIDIVA
ncbi:hypothetical protein AGMMS49543_20790 [Betaproteobacteria bacterium]|nr:hypothetical protein AGMMS49543_20790 [Betaproteobacteria bacterium]